MSQAAGYAAGAWAFLFAVPSFVWAAGIRLWVGDDRRRRGRGRHRRNRCLAILDAKYKAIDDGLLRHDDAYQMLAYCTATASTVAT